MSVVPTQANTITSVFLVSNLHCPSCTQRISDIIWRLSPAPLSVSASVPNRIVTVTHDPALLPPRDIARALLEAEFEIESVALVDGGPSDPEVDSHSPPGTHRKTVTVTIDSGNPFGGAPHAPEAKGLLDDTYRVVKSFVRNSWRGAARRHRDHCEKCRREAAVSDGETILEKELALPSPSPSPPPPPLTAFGDKTAEGAPAGTYQALLSIGGMTCSVCTGKVAETLQDLGPWVSDVSINLMSNSGLVTFKPVSGGRGDGKAEAQQLVDEIESIGYEAHLDRLTKVAAAGGASTATANGSTIGAGGGDSSSPRRIALRIEGMTGARCADKIARALETAFPGAIEIESEPTVRLPILRIAYIPRPPEISIRRIVATLAGIGPADAAGRFGVSAYHPPTIEQRSQEIQRRERNDYLRRLALCVACAVPAFLMGVVWMVLVPATDSVRIFLETPVGAGSVARVEWALLALATPVMFYSASPFHLRAIKEIVALWRRSSSVPILRRFYRFGSMNLLISLGVTISYLSSVAMLVLAARLSPAAHRGGTVKTTTYFDSTIFLTMFLLMGRFLEAYTKAKTANGVSLLAGLRPKEAVLLEPVAEQHAGARRGEIEVPLKAPWIAPSPVPEASDINAEYSDSRPVVARRIPVDLLEAGDLVSIAQGSSPPLDAIVVSGTSSFDESSLTGESRPSAKAAGDEVYAGTLNLGQVINARVARTAGDSLIDRIVDVVREGQNRHAPIERIADRVTAYFVPTICLLAVSTWVVWLGLGVAGALPDDYLDVSEGGWYLWSLSFAIAVFVVACPCGIGLAAPCALHVGTGLATSHAILARGGGEAFQEASKLDCVVFDKTGTLTHGVEPIVTDEKTMFEDGDAEAVKITLLAARLLEEGSSHPLARAIVNYCHGRTAAIGRCLDMQEVAGKGSKGFIEADGSRYEAIVGSERFLHEHGVVLGTEVDGLLDSWKQQGKSVILVAVRSDANDGGGGAAGFGRAFGLAALFATTDPIREEAQFVVCGLQESGIDVWMITGDNPTTASAVARQVGIPEGRVIAGLLPTEKADKIRELQTPATPRANSRRRSLLPWRRWPERKQEQEEQGQGQGQRAIVAMVGDGINDAPAISMADVGISIGSGSDVAMQTSKFILVSSELTSLLTLTDLSRAVVRRIKFNFLWACIFNVIAIPLAAGVAFPFTARRVRLEPVWAALAMALSSVSVICCSLLLKSNIWGVGFRARKMRR